MKFCKDCKFHRLWRYEWKSTEWVSGYLWWAKYETKEQHGGWSSLCDAPIFNLVTGEQLFPHIGCEFNRRTDGNCGPEAKLWKAKEE